MKSFLFILLLASAVISIIGMNEKQMKAAVKLVTNMCLQKTKATSEDIEKMHKGDWDVDHTAMCYMYCALNSYKLINKNNTLNYEAAMNQLGELPERYRDSAQQCTDQCRDAVVSLNEKCTAAYELAKCMYFCNPQKYFLP
ncbi:general odorant-binding protein lush-like [Diorhabda carinulata]|uniref:general odorant-binding protein lush-like n=1 Tax=Diorhabda carinulata TaxID=1163345 RepID=UPI0024E17331|nr:general odorant-binding protein lush-like isoform X1 [Diorhabda sublineata]XP_057653369.1 general odorant-binding protein lush-like [Diorhabda carinulata]